MRKLTILSLAILLILRLCEAQNIDISHERIPDQLRYFEPSTSGPNTEEEFVPLSPVKRRVRAAPIPKRDVTSGYKHFDYREEEEDFDPATATIPPDVEVQQDSKDHRYYQVDTFTGNEEKLKKYWVNVEQFMKKPGAVGNMSHPLLSQSYRRAVGARLQFKFPFYGHKMVNLTIATGGFIYIGDHTHNWLAATQYVAPLMANFHTYLNNSNIVYADDGESFVVEWRNVQLKEEKDNKNAFTFQAILHKNGDIVFIYKNVPRGIGNITDSNHPVKLGISDAYMFKHPVQQSSQPKRVIYEYHRIELLPLEKITSNTVVILKAQPTCISFETCDSCTNATIPHFNCLWCHSKKSHGGPFCTDDGGLHRRRQQWFEGNCYQRSKSLYCDANDEDETYDEEDYEPVKQKDQPTGETPSSGDGKKKTSSSESSEEKQKQKKEEGGGGTFTLTMIVFLLVGIVGWLAYAYYNPHTTSGQMLIKYRPSRWHVPNSHVRYSASVHM